MTQKRKILKNKGKRCQNFKFSKKNVKKMKFSSFGNFLENYEKIGPKRSQKFEKVVFVRDDKGKRAGGRKIGGFDRQGSVGGRKMRVGRRRTGNEKRSKGRTRDRKEKSRDGRNRNKNWCRHREGDVRGAPTEAASIE